MNISKSLSSVIVGSTSAALGALWLTYFCSSIFSASYASISSIFLAASCALVVILNAIILSSCYLPALAFKSSAN
jgi:hypothetical protein